MQHKTMLRKAYTRRLNITVIWVVYFGQVISCSIITACSKRYDDIEKQGTTSKKIVDTPQDNEYIKQKQAATTIQTAVRAHNARSEYIKQKQAATTIQTTVRRHQEKQKQAATTIQKDSENLSQSWVIGDTEGVGNPQLGLDYFKGVERGTTEARTEEEKATGVSEEVPEDGEKSAVNKKISSPNNSISSPNQNSVEAQLAQLAPIPQQKQKQVDDGKASKETQELVRRRAWGILDIMEKLTPQTPATNNLKISSPNNSISSPNQNSVEAQLAQLAPIPQQKQKQVDDGKASKETQELVRRRAWGILDIMEKLTPQTPATNNLQSTPLRGCEQQIGQETLEHIAMKDRELAIKQKQAATTIQKDSENLSQSWVMGDTERVGNPQLGLEHLKRIWKSSKQPAIEEKEEESVVVASIMNYLFEKSRSKKQSFEEGTYMIEDPNKQLFLFLQALKGSYERISSHSIGENQSAHHGFDVPEGWIRPANKRHILFFSTEQNGKRKLFLKPENYGTKKLDHFIHHSIEYLESCVKRYGLTKQAEQSPTRHRKERLKYLPEDISQACQKCIACVVESPPETDDKSIASSGYVLAETPETVNGQFEKEGIAFFSKMLNPNKVKQPEELRQHLEKLEEVLQKYDCDFSDETRVAMEVIFTQEELIRDTYQKTPGAAKALPKQADAASQKSQVSNTYRANEAKVFSQWKQTKPRIN